MENLSTNSNGVTRQFERRPYSKTIDFSISALESKERKWLNLKGKAIDISEAGIGIQTDYPLAPGHMLWFNEGIENKAGFVRWCVQLDNDYRVGIKLDGKHVKHLDEETALFNKQLEEIEKRCIDSEADPDKLLHDVKIVISEVLDACAEFEREVKDKDIIRDARIRFREKTNPYFLEKLLYKPRTNMATGTAG